MAKIILYLLISKTFREKTSTEYAFPFIGGLQIRRERIHKMNPTTNPQPKTKEPDSESLGFGIGLQDLVSKKIKNSLT